MKFFYLKHKTTNEIVMSYEETGEEYNWTCMCLSSWDAETPWLTSEREVDRLLNAEYSDHYAYDLTKDLKTAIRTKQLIKCEVEL